MIEWTERIIRFQFRRTGLNHRAIVKDSNPRPGESLHVTHPYETLCGKKIPIGTGGWGHGQKDCEDCVARMRTLRAAGMKVNPGELPELPVRRLTYMQTTRMRDVLDVFDADSHERIGQICPSDKWAAYRANEMGRIQERRLGTYASISDAVDAIAAPPSL